MQFVVGAVDLELHTHAAIILVQNRPKSPHTPSLII